MALKTYPQLRMKFTDEDGNERTVSFNGVKSRANLKDTDVVELGQSISNNLILSNKGNSVTYVQSELVTSTTVAKNE